MKKFCFLAAAAMMCAASASAQQPESRVIPWFAPEFVEADWNFIGTGYEMPGVFDYFTNEYPEPIECLVYESKTVAGDYWFTPQTENISIEEYLFPCPFVLHAANPQAAYIECVYAQTPLVFGFFQSVPEVLGIKGSAKNYAHIEDDIAVVFPANCFIWGSNPTSEPVSNIGGTFGLYLPEPGGIHGIEADQTEAVYYNLQGMPVENPINGIFIKKSGNSVKKVRK